MSLENFLYGPLGKEYCFLFYFFSIFAMLSMVLLAGTTVYRAAMNKERRTLKSLLYVLPVFCAYFVMYIQNRLLHGMCIKSV